MIPGTTDGREGDSRCFHARVDDTSLETEEFAMTLHVVSCMKRM